MKQNARPLPIDPKATVQNSFLSRQSRFRANIPTSSARSTRRSRKATEWADKHRDEIAALYTEASGVDIAAQKRAVDRAEFTFGPLSDVCISEQQAVADRFQRVGLIPAPIAVRDIVWPWKSNALSASVASESASDDRRSGCPLQRII